MKRLENGAIRNVEQQIEVIDVEVEKLQNIWMK